MEIIKEEFTKGIVEHPKKRYIDIEKVILGKKKKHFFVILKAKQIDDPFNILKEKPIPDTVYKFNQKNKAMDCFLFWTTRRNPE